jgi:hypothetical protein
MESWLFVLAYRKGTAGKFLETCILGENMSKIRSVMHSVGRHIAPFLNNRSRREVFATLIALTCSSAFAAFSLALPAHVPSSANRSEPSRQQQSHGSAKAKEDPDLSRMSPDALAAYVFQHHHCDNCHTMGTGGKLGFNDRGKEVGKNFEGCISLLTSMNVIAQVKLTNRTADENHKAERFEQFGCTTCHQITPGKLGLTKYGQELKSMHMACTEVQRIIAK